MKKIFLILLPVFISILTVYGIYQYFKEDMKVFVLSQIEKFSEETLPVIIKVQGIEMQLLSSSVKLSDVKIIPKKNTNWGVETINIKNIRMNLDFIQALAGRIFLSSIVIDSPVAKLDLDPLLSEDTGSDKLNWEPLFSLLKKIPLYRIAVIKTALTITSKKLNMDLQIGDMDFIAFNQKNSLNMKVDLASTQISFSDKLRFPLSLRADVTLKPETIEVSQADLSALSSKVFLSGEFTDIKKLKTDPQGKFKFEFDLAMHRLKEFFKDSNSLIFMSGNVQLKGQAQLKKDLKTISNFEVTGKELKISTFDIGDLEIKGDLIDRSLKLSDVTIHHPSGDLLVKNLETEIDSFSKMNLKAKISADQLDAHDLLLHLGVGDLPLEFFISGNFDCGGPLLPNLNFVCQGKAKGEDFEFRSGTEKTAKTIADFSELDAAGSVTITNKQVSYKADLKVFEDEGASDGVISYHNGFTINFSTANLHFKNINNLAGLKIEGMGKILGQTSGDSSRAKFSMNLDLLDVYFEDFFLGNTKGLLHYERGNLIFDNIDGQVGSSHYSAHVGVDISKSMISAEGQAPALDVTDLLNTFKRKAKLPIEITGSGSAFVKLNGPLKFNQLTYNLSAQAFRGQIAGESYDRMLIDLSALNGEVKADKVLLAKNKSVISIFGQGHPNGNIDLNIRGDRFLLEESENVSKLSSAISGVFNFQIGLNGHVLSPDMNFRGSLSNLIIEEQEFPNSSVNFVLNKQTLEGQASLLGQRLKSEFIIPINEKAPFRFKAQAHDWNYATLFTLIGGASLLNDYQTTLSGNLELSAENGGLAKATGKLAIDKFLLKRGELLLSNKGPMEMTMKSGVINLNNFKLNGDQSFVEVKGTQFTSDDLKFHVEGNSNLRLFHIFVPFMEEFGGFGKISVNVAGRIVKPEILGTANIESGFAKLKAFPHPFERVKADIQFSASKVLINSYSGNLAGGTFHGDGGLSIEGPKNLPLAITAKVENVNISVPDGVRTIGNADLQFTGSWFPFLLSGTYIINGGLIDKEFDSESALGALRQSSYLPKIILQSAFEPLIFDIQVQIDKSLNIRNSIMEGSLTGQLQIKGPPTQPILLGRITMDKNSKLLFRDKAFELSAGNIQFKNQNEINPELYFSGRARVSDYDVSLLVQGTAKNPQLRLTSSPPLNENDIISLLALGVVTAKTDSRLLSQQKANDDQTTVMAIGSALMSNIKGVKEVKEKYGVNLQLSSSFDDTKNVSVSKITLSKKLSDKVSASASRVQGQQNSNEYKIRYNFNPSVSAVGTYEERQASEDTKTPDTLRKNENILGIDLEYKKEFK